MDYQNSISYGVGSDPVPENFIGPIRRADGSLDELVKRAQMLADRLCGAMPTQAGTVSGKLGLVPAGAIFDDIASTGNRMHSKLGDVHEALQRIERALP